jgi:hypothetical protein
MKKALLIAFLSIAIAAILAIVSGLTGITFRLWPVWINDYRLQITPDILKQLQALRVEKKFLPDLKRLYPGAPDETIRAEAQAIIDATIDRLILDLPSNPRRSTVLKALKRMLPSFERMDSEERDQASLYCKQIMQITGVNSSGELLNVWRYGFPFGWLARH